eukprot:228668_1
MFTLFHLMCTAAAVSQNWDTFYKISTTLPLSGEWKRVYSELLMRNGIDDKYYAFISKPSTNKTLKQLNQLISVNKSQSKPLAGMPIAIKDNIMTIHSLYPTYSGSTAFKTLNFEAPKNAEIVNQLIDLGAIIFGKTNMHELAFGVTSCNQGFGCCINPIDEKRICGGSSGGTAAAIKAGYVTFGLGTDTGGSVRIPSACTNIIGYLPTQDRYSTDGVFPLTHTTDTIGLMSNNINEIILTDWALMQTKNKSCTLTMEEFYDLIDISEIKVGVPKTHFQHEVHPNILKSFNGVLRLMEAHDSFTLINDNDEVFDNSLLGQFPGSPFFNILGYEYPREGSHYLNIYDSNITFKELLQHSIGFERDMMLSFLEENRISVATYHEAMNKVTEIKKIFSDYLNGNNLDIMVYPTIPVEPLLRNEEEKEFEFNGKKYNTLSKIPQNTLPTALAQIPCITIPGVDIEESKFKAGFEMCSVANSDEKLLKIASLVSDIIEQKQ